MFSVRHTSANCFPCIIEAGEEFSALTVQINTVLARELFWYQIYTKCAFFFNFPYCHPEHCTCVYTVHLTQVYLSTDGVTCESMILITIIRTLQLESYAFCTFIALMSPVCVILYLIDTKLFHVQSTL